MHAESDTAPMSPGAGPSVMYAAQVVETYDQFRATQAATDA